jgi:hypothetical protein
MFGASIGWSISHFISREDALWRSDGQNWNYFECLYFLLITFTAVGLGDYAPPFVSKDTVLRFYFQFFLSLLGLSLLVSILEAYQQKIGPGTRKAGKKVKKAGRTATKKIGALAEKRGPLVAMRRGSATALVLLRSLLSPQKKANEGAQASQQGGQDSHDEDEAPTYSR